MKNALQDKIENIFSNKYILHLSVAAVSFLIVFSRRPDALLNPQFWAEDGVVWYAQAYQQGAISIFTPELGYYGTDARIVANIAQILPFACVPLFFNLFSIACKIAVVQILISWRFSRVIPSLPLKLLIAFIYLAIPNAFELDGNLTNAHWHLALLSFLIVIAEPSQKTTWKIFDVITLFVSVLSGPFCFFLFPVACIYWRQKRQGWTLLLTAITFLGCLVQGFSLLVNSRLPQTILGASLELFSKIIGGQIFVSAILGQRGYSWVIGHSLWTFFIAATISFLGIAFMIYALIKVPLELKLFIVYAVLALTASLIAPAAASAADQSQWQILTLPGACTRYWFFPILCLFSTLVYFAAKSENRFLKLGASGLLIISIAGIVRDWKQPPYKNLDFPKHAREFESAPSGTEIKIPVNPSMEMTLVKK